MSKKSYTSNSNGSGKPRKQRALVLQGGGTLGAYEAGVLEVLCKRLSEEDNDNDRKDGLLFDIIAGSSIGAMNGAVFVSNFLNTKSWDKAVEKIQRFWTEQLSVKCMDIGEISKTWYEKWKARVHTAASPEAARRYYSVKNLLVNQVRNNMYYLSEPINDNKFFDDWQLCDQHPECNCNWIVYNEWAPHSTTPLRESIEKYASLPISTSIKNKQPRLLVFSVDVAEGVTVAFDSYPKADGSRKSEYKHKSDKKRKEIVIRYDGVTIDQIMASGTIPEFYKYAPVPIDSTGIKKNHESTSEFAITGKNNDKVRYFTDGGVLSNTPFRELLNAHKEYWKEVERIDEIPDLDVYIINVHASRMDEGKVRPEDYDGVKERHADLTYCDRTSHYDEENAHLIADYANFCNQLKALVDYATDQTTDENQSKVLKDKLGKILSTKIGNETGPSHLRKYEDLPGYAFNLDVVLRIERGSYINDSCNKTGDLTLETINKLIKEGKCDAWFSIIEKIIMDMNLDQHEKLTLINEVDVIWQKLREKDYEDNDSETCHLLTEFTNTAKVIGKTEIHTDRLVKYTEDLKATLD